MKKCLIYIGTIISLVCFFSMSALAKDTNTLKSKVLITKNVKGFTTTQEEDIRVVVHQYLLKNPEILLEVSRVLQNKIKKEKQHAAKVAIEKNKKRLFKDHHSPVMGSKTPQVIMVEFFDYQCGHCKEMSEQVQALLKNNATLQVVFKELPIFGKASKFAAKAALASDKQHKYFGFHDALFAVNGALSNEKVFAAAKNAGLDLAQLKRDIHNPDLEQQIVSNFKLAQDLSLQGTPAFILTNQDMSVFKFIPGATSLKSLQKAVDELKSAVPK